MRRNREGKVCLWSAGEEQLTGHLRQDVLGRNCLEQFLEHVESGSQPLLEGIPLLLHTIREEQTVKAPGSSCNISRNRPRPAPHPRTSRRNLAKPAKNNQA
jgi:hypothetical protein